MYVIIYFKYKSIAIKFRAYFTITLIFFLCSVQEKVCPNCRKVIDINRNVIIFLGDEQMHQELLQAKISEINLNLDRQNKTINNAFEQMLTVLTEQNNLLRKENLEMKDMLKNICEGAVGFSGTGGDAKLREQLRVKDDTIVNLRKEIQELKLQRAEATKNMEEIQKQVHELKNRQLGDRSPLKAVNASAPKQPISLSLKFDDFTNLDKADQL